MFGDQKDTQENLKDSTSNQGISLKDSYSSPSYTKTNKLVTALYMVTDVLDKDEPIRNKLRTLGTEVISDIINIRGNARLVSPIDSKIAEIMSFLDIASAISMISPMNCNILKKEFLALKESIEESKQNLKIFSGESASMSLTEFLKDDELQVRSIEQPRFHSMGHSRIGVQKGSTLMRALSKVSMSDRNARPFLKDNFDVLKKERRYEITSFLKTNPNGVTITDIKTKANGVLASCSEKTLQRELISLVKDGVLKKMGEKRWSRYFLAN